MPRVRAALKPSAHAPPTTCDAAPSVCPPPLPPTPPRTTHKRKRRSRSRVTDSSSEDEDDFDVPKPESDDEDDCTTSKYPSKADAVLIGHKKRRTLALDAIAEELTEARAEEAFWMGDSKTAASSEASGSKPRPPYKVVRNRAPTRKRSRTRSPSSSPPPAPHLLRRGHSGLISPPPSRRAPKVVPRPATPPPPAQETKKGKDTALPAFDSPNNPFLASDSPASAPGSEDLSSPEPRTPRKHIEKPTVTYVFRGIQVVRQNPHYVGRDEDAERDARARLPIEHPEFSPTEACAPKLLFPEARKRDLIRRRIRPAVPVPTSPTPTASRRRTGSLSSDEGRAAMVSLPVPGAPGPSNAEEEEDFDAMAAAMAARVARRITKGVIAEDEVPRTRESSRMRELPKPPEKDRSDMIKRALGPPRRAA